MSVVVRDLPGADAGALLRGVLGAVEFGVLFTDLKHVALFCNDSFGRMFGIDPSRVVHSDPEEVRAMVRRRIADLDEWNANLEEVYADPERVQRDSLRLLHPAAMLERYTGPVRDEEGRVVGRIWTFTDVTLEDARKRVRDSLHEASFVVEPDPATAYRRLTELIGRHYGAIALLSIRRDGFMEFRAVGGPPSPARTMRGNDIRDSFCQLCLEQDKAVLVQDGRKNPRTARLLPVQLGLTRYLGVPVRDPYGQAIGTLCILDSRSDEPLNDEDLSFLGQIAARISNELDRESRENTMRQDSERVQGRLLHSERLASAGLVAMAVADELSEALAEGGTDRLSVLAERLRVYERPDEIRLAQTSVEELLDDALARFAPALEKAGIRVERQQEEANLPKVHADAARLTRLLLSLVYDALKGMPNGGTYRLRLWRESGEVRLEASDDRPNPPRPGFEPFRADEGSDAPFALNATREIVRECGGRLESLSGVGAVYRLEIPTV
ncbi:hypothetical protein BH11ARM2_BH11ARM2_15990 [soil metagenome]